jgi:hypothetical protein
MPPFLMSIRTAAIVIDDFLNAEQWQYVQNNLSKYIDNAGFVEDKGEPYPQIIEWMEEKLASIGMWQEHWSHMMRHFSYINTLPPGIDRESASGGYHSEFGGFIYYAHPSWDSSWGGHLKFKDCSVEQIEPKPNRFVWINPVVWHGIEVVNSNAQHNRITVVGWPEGCLEYPNATLTINTNIEG